MRTHLIVVGETIVNVTYRCSAPLEGSQVPYASFDEEYLELRERNLHPTVSLQGAVPIANYWREVGQKTYDVSICTEVANEGGPLVPHGLFDKSATGLGPRYVAPLVTRILRNPESRVGNLSRRARPVFRIDRVGQLPADFKVGLKGVIEAIPKGDRKVCLVRSVTPGFFGKKPSDAEMKEPLKRLMQLQQDLQEQDVELILDVRPIPPRLRILDRRTIVSSTIQRLRDLTGSSKDSAEDVVLDAFWKLAPCRGLLCFSAFDKKDGAVFCLRDETQPAVAKLYRGRVERPQEVDFPDAGLVSGGDAFLAAFVTEWLWPTKDEKQRAQKALGMAGAALHAATESPMGEYPQRNRLSPLRVDGPLERQDPQGDRLHWAKRMIRLPEGKAMQRNWPGTNVTSPRCHDRHRELIDPLCHQLETLSKLLKNWRPHPGRDVLAIFGESRCGKEYPLKELLLHQKAFPVKEGGIVGPINQFELLATIKDVANVLKTRSEYNQPSVLLIDEIVKGDAARSLLNLLAEKKHSTQTAGKPEELDFSKTLIILLTSIDRDELLADVRGRLAGFIEVPPLRERWMELPFALPRSLNQGLRYWKPPRTLRVSHRLMSALLHYDYRARPEDELGTPGLNQQNFRAFEDILAATYRAARGQASSRDYVDWLKTKRPLDRVDLQFSHLPLAIAELSPRAADDDKWFTYDLKTEPGGPDGKFVKITNVGYDVDPEPQTPRTGSKTVGLGMESAFSRDG